MDLVDMCEEKEALDRRVKMQRNIIQQVKLEIVGEKMQHIILHEETHPVDQLDK
jgi:hypothetical protein